MRQEFRRTGCLLGTFLVFVSTTQTIGTGVCDKYLEAETSTCVQTDGSAVTTWPGAVFGGQCCDFYSALTAAMTDTDTDRDTDTDTMCWFDKYRLSEKTELDSFCACGAEIADQLAIEVAMSTECVLAKLFFASMDLEEEIDNLHRFSDDSNSSGESASPSEQIDIYASLAQVRTTLEMLDCNSTAIFETLCKAGNDDNTAATIAVSEATLAPAISPTSSAHESGHDSTTHDDDNTAPSIAVSEATLASSAHESGHDNTTHDDDNSEGSMRSVSVALISAVACLVWTR